MDDYELQWKMTRTGHDAVLESYYQENGWETPDPEAMDNWWQVYQIWLKEAETDGISVDAFLAMLRESTIHKEMQECKKMDLP